jgi:hypothetical protein
MARTEASNFSRALMRAWIPLEEVLESCEFSFLIPALAASLIALKAIAYADAAAAAESAGDDAVVLERPLLAAEL